MQRWLSDNESKSSKHVASAVGAKRFRHCEKPIQISPAVQVWLGNCLNLVIGHHPAPITLDTTLDLDYHRSNPSSHQHTWFRVSKIGPTTSWNIYLCWQETEKYSQIKFAFQVPRAERWLHLVISLSFAGNLLATAFGRSNQESGKL